MSRASAPPTLRRRARSLLRARRPTLVPLAAGVLTIILIGGVIVAFNVVSPRPDRADTAGGPAILYRAADTLESGSSDAVRLPSPDQWHYQKYVVWELMGEKETEEQWTKVNDGASASRYNGGEIEKQTEDIIYDPTSHPLAITPGEMFRLYQDLPEDTGAVVDKIYKLVEQENQYQCTNKGDPCLNEERTAPASDRDAFGIVARLLAAGPPPADVQASLVRALAHIPGVEDDGTVKDPTGQEAIALGWDHTRAGVSYRHQILLDPDTFTYRGGRTLDYGLKYGGPLMQSTTLVNSGFVNKTGHIP